MNSRQAVRGADTRAWQGHRYVVHVQGTKLHASGPCGLGRMGMHRFRVCYMHDAACQVQAAAGNMCARQQDGQLHYAVLCCVPTLCPLPPAAVLRPTRYPPPVIQHRAVLNRNLFCASCTCVQATVQVRRVDTGWGGQCTSQMQGRRVGWLCLQQ
jgi:hypothetical protein